MEGDYAPRNEAEPTEEEPTIVRVNAPFYPLEASAAGYGALMSVDYAACEQTKARSLASLPVSVIRNGANREKVDHPIARLLNGMANEEMTGADLLNWHRLRIGIWYCNTQIGMIYQTMRRIEYLMVCK